MTLRTTALAALALSGLTACTGGGSDEPAPFAAANDDLSEPGLATWCGATLEDVGLDDVVDGFDATPRDALEAVSGGFVGATEGASVALSLVLDPAVQVARVQTYDADTPAPAEAVPVSVCADHYVLTGAMGLDALPLVGLDADVEIAYADGEDAGDGFGWDTAFFSLRTDAWDGYAAPSWDPGEMEVVEMVLFARWAGGSREGTGRTGTDVDASIWTVDLSFWGESLPTGTGDDAAVWAGEELLFTADLHAADPT